MNTRKKSVQRLVVLGLLVVMLLSGSALAAGYGVTAEIDPENATVTAAVTAPEKCRVVVAWYDGEGQLLYLSMWDTSGGKYSFPWLASDSAPQNVSAKVFLIDKDTYLSLCPAANAVKRSQAIELPVI